MTAASGAVTTGGCALQPQSVVALAVAVLVGVAITVQGVLNNVLMRAVGLWEGTLIVQVVGVPIVLLGLLIAPGPGFGQIGKVPWYGLVGGALGAFIITGIVVAIGRLGAGAALTLVVAAQLVAAAAVDQVGWLGLERQPLTPTRLLGIGLLLAGALLINRRP